MVVQLVARLFELISQCWASLSELTERELDKMAYIVEYSCLSVIDLWRISSLNFEKELEFFFFFVVSFRRKALSNYGVRTKGIEANDRAVFFIVEKLLEKFWGLFVLLFFFGRINEELKWIDRSIS